MTPAGGAAGGDGEAWKAQALARFGDWYGIVPAAIERTDARAVVRQDIHDLKPTRTWSAGRVALLGDAAHATTPALGQGGCMAIEDAVVLARGLAEDDDVPAALRRYTSRRRGRTNRIVRAARRHGRLYHGASPAAQVLRDTFLGTAPVPVAMRVVDRLMGYEA